MTDVHSRLAPALADRYRIERELGAGGMATVYLVQDIRHDRRVALKVLKPELAAVIGAERFLQEIKTTANLQHPHILGLIDSGETNGLLWYVMPFVEGPSLRQRLLRERELPIVEAVRILRDVADALAHAHQHGVVHRDIKPENVMLSGRHAVVTDFGVAKAVGESTGRQALTSAGVALGTPTYMAPEQATGDPHVDHRADIYSWGVIAYELLSGQLPFDRATPQAMLAAQVTEAAPPVTKHRPSIPAGLAMLVMRALEKRPADRWQRAEELIQPLEALLTPSGESTPTLTPRVTTLSAQVQRKPVVIGGGMLLATAAVVAAVVFWPSAPEYVPNRVVVVPLESQGGDSSLEQFGRQMMATLTDAIGQEGVGDPVPVGRVRDLTVGTREASLDVADRVARETAAGLVFRGACSPKGGQTECQLELLRMPGRVPRLSFIVVGDHADPRFSAELSERAAVTLLLQLQWGDRATWRGEYVPSSLEAVREFNDAFDLWSVDDTSAAGHFQRAATLDPAWILPAAWHLRYLAPSFRDSALAAMARRPGLRASDREVVGVFQAWVRGDWERAYDLVSRRFKLHPEMWLTDAVVGAYQTQRPETALRYFQYADSVRRLRGSRLATAYLFAGYSLHQLGRYQEEVKLAAVLRERLPEQTTRYRTIEILGQAGAGNLARLQQVVEEAEASVEPSGNWGGSRAYIAAHELMAHGWELEGRRMFANAVRFYRRLREENGPSGYTGFEVWGLFTIDRLEEARALALELLQSLRGPDSVSLLGDLGIFAAHQNRRDEALSYSTQLLQFDRPYSYGRVQFRRAAIAAQLGDREAAIRLLQEARAAGLGDGTTYVWLHRDTEWLSLRGYPPFEQLLKPKG